MITPLRALTINDISQRLDDLVVSKTDVKKVVENDRKELRHIIAFRINKLKETNNEQNVIAIHELEKLLDIIDIDLIDNNN